MKISEVTELIGITKKAVNYYEEEGLIKPCVNSENNYRDYSKDDVDTLIQISLLRQIDVPVKGIKSIMHSPKLLKETLEQHLAKLNEEAIRLEKNRDILQSCLENLKNETPSELAGNLLLLKKALEMDESTREDFMKKQILKIFPGSLGKMILAMCGGFLNEPIDTPEKRDAWIWMVDYLDNADEASYPEHYKKIAAEEMSDEDFCKINNEFKKWISITDEEMLQEKEKIVQFFDSINNNPEAKATILSNFKDFKNLNPNYLENDEKFDNALKILSKDYTKIIENMTKFRKKFEFIEDINPFLSK